MVKQVILSKCGIKFDDEAMKRADIDVSTIIAPTQPDVEIVSEADDGLAIPTSLAPPSSPGEDGSVDYIIQKGKDKEPEEQPWSREQEFLTDIHDELKVKPLWWLLEIVPIKFIWQEADGTWKSKWGVNLGRGRQIRDAQPNFHNSVRQRMAAEELRYKPRAKWTPGTERYVD